MNKVLHLPLIMRAHQEEWISLDWSSFGKKVVSIKQNSSVKTTRVKTINKCSRVKVVSPHFLSSKRKPAKVVYLGKIAAGKITVSNFKKQTPSQVPFIVKFFRVFFLLSTYNINFTLNQDKGMCSLKIHHNSNECQHDILYVRNVVPINKIHAQSCNRNRVKLKKQSTRTISTLFWCLSLYKAKVF